jgi:heme exporter protein D
MPFFLTEHFWRFFFAEHGHHFYEAAVWGNVVAVLPLAILGASGFVYHHTVLKRAHESHDAHLKAILAALDPESETDSQLDRIADAVDTTTPGGLTDVLAAINKEDR